jgi:hypothetical protein
MSQYHIPARVTLRTTVIVEANSMAEALKKFNALDWEDDGFSNAATVDFEISGSIEEDVF